jgi:hypothetical protein
MPISPRTLGLFAPLSILLATFGACSSSPPAEELSSAEQDLYGLGSIGTAWQVPVPVCFQNPTDHPELQALVKSTLTSSWAQAANISFTGFGGCPTTGKVAAVFFQSSSVDQGSTSPPGPSGFVTSLPNDVSQARFTAVVTHEFGHVHGIAHEMARPDNWDGGVALQCAAPAGATNADQYAERDGGVNLTPNYDPDSIMNYCADSPYGAPALSVGDILGVSQSAYGPNPACVFKDAVTSCNTTSAQTFEETFTVPSGCPAPWNAWVLQTYSGGAWNPVQSSCPGGQPAGTCGAMTNPNSFTFGTQSVTGALTGPAVGSVLAARMCDPHNNCTPTFDLTISACNMFYLDVNDDPMQVSPGGTGMAYLIMNGAWQAADQGLNATAQLVNNNDPIPGAHITFSPGTTIDGRGAINMVVTAPAGTSTTDTTYAVPVQGTDLASGVTLTTTAHVKVLACTTTPASTVCTSGRCNQWSVGCGEFTDCGGCPTGDYCSSGICCPTGYSNDGEGGCVSNTPPPPPTNCPLLKPYCAALNACATAIQCKNANGGGGGTCKPGTCM